MTLSNINIYELKCYINLFNVVSDRMGSCTALAMLRSIYNILTTLKKFKKNFTYFHSHNLGLM